MSQARREAMTRRRFSQALAVATGGLVLGRGRAQGADAAAAPSVIAAPPVATTGAKSVEGIEARLEGRIMHLDYRLSTRSSSRLKLAPARATFITAIHLASQTPLCCRSLAKVKGVTMTGPVTDKDSVRYQASVDLSALMELAKGFQILVHASFWQHRSGVLFFKVDA